MARNDKAVVPPLPEDRPEAVAVRAPRALPMPPEAIVNLYSVAHDQQNGAPILRIRARADGDEITIDAQTGRLLSVRAANGKLMAWPNAAISTQGTQLPAKSS